MAAAEDDLRSQLESAFQSAREAPDTPEPEAPAPDKPAEAQPTDARPRDERGRFASAPDKPAAESVPTEATPEAPKPNSTETKPNSATEAAPVAAAVPAPPNGWAAEAKAKWHELPPEIQAAVAKREQDIAKFAGKTDEERSFGRDMQRVITPYLPVIRASGATPAEAVSALLNTAYILRAGSPQQKQQALLSVAREYGVDLGQPQPTGASGEANPEVAALKAEIASLRQQLTPLAQQYTYSQQQTQADIQRDLAAFAADPANSHFHEVKAHMAALLRSGLAADLKDAYDQACYARPDIRTTLQAQARAAEEQKRRSEEQARAAAAKAKGISITGGPGAAASKSAPSDRSLRDELVANFRASTGAV